jgi:radical SAM protein with 4Fe4S-binding SPASM domain
MVTLELHITDKCNSHCLHCYGNYSYSNAAFLPATAAAKAIDDITVLNRTMSRHSHISLSGGEPLLHPDFAALVDRAARNADSVSVLSNGILLSRDVARCISNFTHIFVQLSMEGSEATHDRIRGPGHYQKVLKALENLQAFNVETFCSMTVGHHNITEIDAFLRQCKNLDVNPVLHRYMPGGRADDELKLNYKDNMRLYRAVIKNMKRYRIRPHCSLCSMAPLIKDPSYHHECNIGKNCLVVQAGGDIVPCPYIPVSHGNIAKIDLSDYFFNSPELEAFREREYGKVCRKCPDRQRCGGCRAITLGYTGDVFGDEPLCPRVRKDLKAVWMSRIFR